MKHQYESSDSHHKPAESSLQNHHDANQAEHKILESLRQNSQNSNSEIVKELNNLRDIDRLSGKDFNKDLQFLNKQLNQDLAKLHLPSISITEDGKEFQVKSAEARSSTEHQFHQLPPAVQHAIRHNIHRHHRRGAGSFVPPQHGRPDSDTTPPDPDGKPIDTSESSPSKSGFGEKLLNKLGMPVTKSNLDFLDAWQKAEGGSADNPFNTTQNMPGARKFNSVGVKRYPSVDVGIDATAKTLTNGYYNEILSALKSGENAHKAAVAVSHTPWGTGGGVARIV